MPSIDLVAKQADVSKSTVSRSFSRPESVEETTRRRVLRVAEELGYQPHRVARSLAIGRRGAVGMVVPDITNPFVTPMIKTVQQQARRHDLGMYLADSDEHAEDEFPIVRSMCAQVDGLVLASPRMSDDEVRKVVAQVPVVVVNRHVERVPAVLMPARDGMAQAVEHLVALGHQRLVYLAGRRDSVSNVNRRQGILQAGRRCGVEVAELGPFSQTFEAGVRAADLVLADGASAVIAYNDLIALGLMNQLAARGVRPGSEVSVVGIDDMWLAAAANPPLTTVRIPGTQASSVALRILLDLINGHKEVSTDPVELPTDLVVRASTGPRDRSG